DAQTMVQASLPLDLFRRAARTAAAARGIEVADRALADRARTLVNDVKIQYGRAAAGLRDLTVASDLVSTARRQLELLDRRVEEGAAPPLERDLLAADVRRLEAERLLA